eukprot:4952614-Ditylum_brightwellii.AAC.1
MEKGKGKREPESGKNEMIKRGRIGGRVHLNTAREEDKEVIPYQIKVRGKEALSVDSTDWRMNNKVPAGEEFQNALDIRQEPHQRDKTK